MVKILSLFISMLVLAGCSRLDVSVDYDESYDFKSAKTFVVDSSAENSKNTLFAGRVTNALENELKLKGQNNL